MVARTLNKPAFKVGKSLPICWFHQVHAQWFCRLCGHQQEKGAVAVEMTVKMNVRRDPEQDAQKGKGFKEPYVPVKVYLCLNCAELMFTDINEKVKLIKAIGPDAFQMFEAV